MTETPDPHNLSETVRRMFAAALIRADKDVVFPKEALAQAYEQVRDRVVTMLVLEGLASTRENAVALVPEPTDHDLASIGAMLLAANAGHDAIHRGTGAAAIDEDHHG